MIYLVLPTLQYLHVYYYYTLAWHVNAFLAGIRSPFSISSDQMKMSDAIGRHHGPISVLLQLAGQQNVALPSFITEKCRSSHLQAFDIKFGRMPRTPPIFKFRALAEHIAVACRSTVKFLGTQRLGAEC